MKKIILLVLFIILGLGLYRWLRPSSLVENIPMSSRSDLRTLHVGSQTLQVEVADDVAEITKGLGYRDELGSDGMLFLLPSKSIPSFWMRGMRFPLDFVWIDGERVVDLTENVAHEPGVEDMNLKIYSPNVAVDKVLELATGDIAKRGIMVGDVVRLEVK